MRLCSVRRIHNQNFPAQIANGFDVGLGNQFILRGISAHNNDNILVGEFDHGHGIVNRQISNITLTGGEFSPQFVGVFLVLAFEQRGLWGWFSKRTSGLHALV